MMIPRFTAGACSLDCAPAASLRPVFAAGILTALVAAILPAQTNAARGFKGIWEPVHYGADIQINDVLFVTPDIGWAASGRPKEGGAIIHTRDGGATWDLAVGDPESAEPPIDRLYFLDATHGWALQSGGVGNYKVLRTTDGESWEHAGSFDASWGVHDYVFLSESEGVLLDANDNVSRILRTSDGGRTWDQVFLCETQAQYEGLTKDVSCSLKGISFPTPQTGYAVGASNGAYGSLFVAKTSDGGRTWSVHVVPDLDEDLRPAAVREVRFTDEAHGLVQFGSKLFRTTDGGQSWRGVIATAGERIVFADPEVGWSFHGHRTMSYTTNGGARWTSRELPFPSIVNAFSLPRRDRGYVVGDHGMVYRYRVIPAAEATPPKAIAAPAMPPFAPAVHEQVEELETRVDALSALIAAQDTASTNGGAAPEGEAVCCMEEIADLQSATESLMATVPEQVNKYRNLNLVIAGLQLASDVSAYLGSMKVSFDELRQARSPAAMAELLTQLRINLDGLSAATAQFQQSRP